MDGLATKVTALDLKSTPSGDTAEIKTVLLVFSQLSAPRGDVSAAYAYLARLLLSSNDGTSPDDKGRHLDTVFRLIGDWLSEMTLLDSTNGFAALTALLNVDVAAVATQMHDEVMKEHITDAIEMLAGKFQIVNESELHYARKQAASYISAASGYPQMRPFARSLAAVENGWLYAAFKDADNPLDVRAVAAVASIKLQVSDGPLEQQALPPFSPPTSEDLMDFLSLQIITLGAADSSDESGITAVLLEGLALVSLSPDARRKMTATADFLKGLLNLAKATSGNLSYSLAVILKNVTAYHRAGDEETEAKKYIRQYASAGGQKTKSEVAETDPEVNDRIKTLMQLDVMQATHKFSKHPSPGVRGLAGRSLLHLVDDRARRGTILQQGGAALLLVVLRNSASFKATAPTAGSAFLNADDLAAAQALAKLLITTNPSLVFGTDASGSAIIFSITILCTALVDDPGIHTKSQASLLQQFESLMALTNIAGLAESLQDRIAKFPHLIDALSDFLLDGQSRSSDSTLDGRGMRRRAAVQLLCNLASCETIFNLYTGIDWDHPQSEGPLPAQTASRLRLLLALCDSEDKDTSLAALAAIYSFSAAPNVSAVIANTPKAYEALRLAATDPDHNVQLRAIMILRNVAVQCHSRTNEISELLKPLANDVATSGVHPDVRDTAKDVLSELQTKEAST